MTAIKNFINDESGMETLEYALIAGLIAIVAIFVSLQILFDSKLSNQKRQGQPL